MANLRKRKTKTGWIYDIDFRFKGKRCVVSTRTSSYATARKVLAEIESRIIAGRFRFGEFSKKDVTLGVLMKEYLEHGRSYKRPATQVLEEKYLLGELGSVLGLETPVRSIDLRMLDRWKTAFASRVRPATANISIRMVHALFNKAKMWGYVDESPARGLQKLKVEETRFFLLDDELARVFALIDAGIREEGMRGPVIEFRKQFRLFIEFLLNTGLRRGEAVGLQSKNVDLPRNLIFIENTKTKQLRMIPLNRRAREILGQLGNELFTNMNEDVVSQQFAKYLKRAGLKGFKLHSLRHTFATRLAARGVDIYTISRLLGHTDLKTTMIYAKASPMMLRQAVDKLELDGKTLVRFEDETEKGQ